MPEKKTVEIEAKSSQEAIAIALKKLGAKRNEVIIKILDEESKGLFRLEGSRKAKVRVIVRGRK